MKNTPREEFLTQLLLKFKTSYQFALPAAVDSTKNLKGPFPSSVNWIEENKNSFQCQVVGQLSILDERPTFNFLLKHFRFWERRRS